MDTSETISPTPTKPSFDPIFLSGVSEPTTAISRVPSRLPSPAASDSAPYSPTIPCNLPPSPSASPIPLLSGEALSKPTLLTLPSEILRHILWYCSSPSPNLFRLARDQIYIDRMRRNLPDLPIGTAKALYATCHSLRHFLLDLGLRGEGLRIQSTCGILGWKLTPPIWSIAKEINLRWDDGGMIIWPFGVEEAQWKLIKSRSDATYGPQTPVEEPPTQPPKRADQINMSGGKPKDLKAYMEACRAYIKRPPPPPPAAKKHKPGVREEVGMLLSGCGRLETLTMDFPGALEVFTEVVMGLKEEEILGALGNLKTLTLRNGSEMCFPPPKKLCVAISRLHGVEAVSVQGNCGGRDGLFSVRDRRKRGVYVAEGGEYGDVVGSLWGWECEALEMPKKPGKLRICTFLGMPGLGEGAEGRSSGVWSTVFNGWPGESRLLVEGMEMLVGEELKGWVWRGD
ncbi:hypothetical protein L211DRAFT_850412 [Terfezia boudieri ATCC MYA-4762]|uniref:Uncharacterized protein n=1 Tax=Terfezia boudieri ATCC MYA-4762 TaxID=1051890 RepID=A0A3N4LLN2_9PEZI|nr:hypothetical protein L211DRAFT_850412 [Terfezia boudieri ATCC MYA-4762]